MYKITIEKIIPESEGYYRSYEEIYVQIVERVNIPEILVAVNREEFPESGIRTDHMLYIPTNE